MPLYRFLCKNNHQTERFYSLAEWREEIQCPNCSRKATICFATNLQVHTFKPYTEDNFTGKPIEITSKAQRDALCKKHGVTYDSNKYHRKPKPQYAVDDVKFDEVKRAAERGRLDDGTSIQGTVSEQLPED